MTLVTDHPNVTVVTKFYEAYGKHDLEGIREVLSEDVSWTIPSYHSLAGIHRGIEQVIAFFDALAKANFKAEVLFLGGNDNYVVDCHRGWGEYNGLKIDINWCLLFKIENGKIVSAQNFAGDQHAADVFYSAVWPLKPLPERLAK